MNQFAGKTYWLVGEAKGADIIVSEGLAKGDTVIAAGVSQILDGMQIRPITAVGE